MKRHSLLIIVLVAVTAIMSCEYLINPKNLFAGLEADPTAKYDSMTAKETFESLQRDKTSGTFYSKLTAETTASIIAKLDSLIATAVNTGNQTSLIDASLLKAEIILNTTPTGQVVNSVVDGLLNIANFDNPSQVEILTSFMEPIASASESEFSSFIESMLSLADIYQTVGDAITPGQSILEPAVAQTATLSLLVEAMHSAIEVPSDSPEGTTVTTILYDAMQAVFDDDDQTSPEVSFKDDSETLVSDTIAEGSDLDKILRAAGLSSFADLVRDLL